MKNLKNLQMLFNYRRLRNVRRANNLPTIQTEDVAQHSFYVTILATALAEDYNAHVENYNRQFHPIDLESTYELVDVSQVTRQALFHDMEEVFTSDIPWNVKHHDGETNLAIRKCIWEKLGYIYQDTTSPISQHKDIICNAKSGLAGKFVNVADSLEGTWYCYTELTMGNQYIQGLFLKYLEVVQEDPFIPQLYQFSPLFTSIMEMFFKQSQKCEPTVDNISPEVVMILD